MKTYFFAIAAIFAMAATTVQAQTQKSIDLTQSTIEWEGRKVTGTHDGLIDFQSGSLEFEDDALVGGSFTVDMTSIRCTDLDGEGAAKLEGHLKSEDFFGVEDHPTATLKLTKVTPGDEGVYQVEADVVIKGISKPVGFEVFVTEGKASTSFKVDRTAYDIRYGSGTFFENLGDKTISDDFELRVDLMY